MYHNQKQCTALYCSHSSHWWDISWTEFLTHIICWFPWFWVYECLIDTYSIPPLTQHNMTTIVAAMTSFSSQSIPHKLQDISIGSQTLLIIVRVGIFRGRDSDLEWMMEKKDSQHPCCSELEWVTVKRGGKRKKEIGMTSGSKMKVINIRLSEVHIWLSFLFFY